MTKPLNPTEIDFIRRARVARLATIGSDGTPALVPICFALIGDDQPMIVSVLDEKPKRVEDDELARVRNIRRNPQVGFIVDHYDEDWTRLAFVQIRGVAQIIQPDDALHPDAISALRDKHQQYHTMAIGERQIIVIQSERVISWGRM
jgi:PPOX class probable F420-dependent enzyme